MADEEFLCREIAAQLSARYGETQAGTAARHAVAYMQSNPRATLHDAIKEAKWFAKHNYRPAPPERKTPIVKSRLPARGHNR